MVLSQDLGAAGLLATPKPTFLEAWMPAAPPETAVHRPGPTVTQPFVTEAHLRQMHTYTTHGTPGRRLRYRPPGGGEALAPGKFCSHAELPGEGRGEGIRPRSVGRG